VAGGLARMVAALAEGTEVVATDSTAAAMAEEQGVGLTEALSVEAVRREAPGETKATDSAQVARGCWRGACRRPATCEER
jgi:ABC-type hemin transport system substrate-binding protein